MITAACFLVVLLALGYGWHKTARRLYAERTEHAEVLAAKDTTIEHAQARADNAEHSRDLAEDRARLAESLHDDTSHVLRGTTVQLQEWAKQNEREFAMPTINGNRDDLLDRIDAMEDGERIDYMDELAGRPLTFVAPVVPIKKRVKR